MKLISPPKPRMTLSATAAIENMTIRVQTRRRNGSSNACATSGIKANRVTMRIEGSHLWLRRIAMPIGRRS